MKRNFIFGFICSVLTVVSCEKGQGDASLSNENDAEGTNMISLEEARGELEDILRNLDEQSGGTSEFSGKVITEEFSLGGGNVLTRSGGGDRSSLYVFNFGDEGGFAIMSGRVELPPLLALSYSGTFTEESAEENPGLGIFLSDIWTVIGDIESGKFVEDVSDGMVDETKDYEATWVVETESIIYLTSGNCVVKWGQDHPYNMFCPDSGGVTCLTGCVATAVAQLMSIYKYPDSYDGYRFDWDEMTAEECADSLPEAAKEQVARLMRLLGDDLKMSYGPIESTAPTGNVPGTLKDFGYSGKGTVKSYDTDRVVSELKNGYGLLVVGYTAKRGDENNMGHMWLCHGLMEGRTTIKRYVNGELYGTGITKSEWYVLCNWGKDGKHDGYYLSGVFDTGSSGSGSGAYYKYNLTTVTGIRL